MRLLTLSLLASAAATLAVGCASPQGQTPPPARTADGPSRVIDATSTEPIAASAVTMHVRGLSCPLCATNVDRQLTRIEGVQSAHVDLSVGEVYVEFAGKDRPSAAMLARAVVDSGFTLHRIEEH